MCGDGLARCVGGPLGGEAFMPVGDGRLCDGGRYYWRLTSGGEVVADWCSLGLVGRFRYGHVWYAESRDEPYEFEEVR